MINTLTIATRGRLSNSVKRTLTYATLGKLVTIKVEPIPKPSAPIKGASGYKVDLKPVYEIEEYSSITQIMREDNEILNIIKIFLQCQK